MNFDALLGALKTDEGLRLVPYLDTASPPKVTIGYGCNLTDGITKQEAHDLLVGRAIKAQQYAASLVPSWMGLNDTRQNVLSNMSYNMGTRLSGFHGLLAAVEAQNWQEASAEMLDSSWAGQVGRRAQRLAKEMLTGIAEPL